VLLAGDAADVEVPQVACLDGDELGLELLVALDIAAGPADGQKREPLAYAGIKKWREVRLRTGQLWWWSREEVLTDVACGDVDRPRSHPVADLLGRGRLVAALRGRARSESCEEGRRKWVGEQRDETSDVNKEMPTGLRGDRGRVPGHERDVSLRALGGERVDELCRLGGK
jgi:hypothetical protein